MTYELRILKPREVVVWSGDKKPSWRTAERVRREIKAKHGDRDALHLFRVAGDRYLYSFSFDLIES